MPRSAGSCSRNKATAHAAKYGRFRVLSESQYVSRVYQCFWQVPPHPRRSTNPIPDQSASQLVSDSQFWFSNRGKVKNPMVYNNDFWNPFAMFASGSGLTTAYLWGHFQLGKRQGAKVFSPIWLELTGAPTFFVRFPLQWNLASKRLGNLAWWLQALPR